MVRFGKGACMAVLVLVSWSAADEAPKDKGGSLSELALEVEALRTLYYFNFSREQVQQVRELAKETTDKFRPRLGKANKEYRKLLGELRTALADPTDADWIAAIETKIDKLLEKEEPELSIDYEVTVDARVRAPEVLKLLKPSQVAGYLALFPDDVQDPLDLMALGLDQVRKADDDAWEDLRDGLAYEAASLVAGANSRRADHVTAQVTDLLDKARSLKEDDFKAQRKDLEKKARDIVGNIGPTDVLQNYVERALAEMLSNPQLAAALATRLK